MADRIGSAEAIAKHGRVLRPIVERVPEWNGLTWLRAGFSTRAGGETEVYGGYTLNLGWTREDDPAVVAANREAFAVEVAGAAVPLIGLRQIHSAVVRVVKREPDGRLVALGSGAGLTGAEGRPMLRGDGLMTDVPGVLLGVGVADCVPVVVADPRRKAVAAFHAGWRGTLAQIVERGIGRMRRRYGSDPQDLVAAVGPAIGPCCYAVGQDFRVEFESQFAYARDLFSENGPQLYLNLWEANRRQLVDAGLKQENIRVAGECTACARTGDGLKYFSHRGEGGFAGRGLGAIGIFG